METIFFDIRHGDGRHERTHARASRIVVGSGAHCDVRLAADQAAGEHVLIECLPSGPEVRCIATSPPCHTEGNPLTTRALTDTLSLWVGATHLEITRAPITGSVNTRSVKVIMVAKVAILAALGAVTIAVSGMNRAESLPASPRIPELFPKASAECPRVDAAEARALADDQRVNGDGARERSPFDPREARAAINSYEIASACYRLVQNASASDDAAQSARRIRDETTLDFRARRVRLDRLLLVKDYEVAMQDVIVLRALTDGQPGDYVQWLSTVAQDIRNQRIEPTP